MKLWHDDIRRPPDNSWKWARTNEQAKELLASGEVVEASLDHDLGLHDEDPDELGAHRRVGHDIGAGYALVEWMCETGYIPARVSIHSWNSSGAERMAVALRGAGCQPSVRPYQLPGPWAAG